MATWAELLAFAKKNYEVVEDEQESFALLLAGEGRRQKIVVRHSNLQGHEWINMLTGVCKEDELKHADALKLNGEFYAGALALMDGLYVLTYTLPLKTLEMDEFELPLNVLAVIADDLERTYAKGGDTF